MSTTTKMLNRDKEIIWDEVHRIIQANKLDHLYRSQDTIEKYRAYKTKLTQENTTIVEYIIRNRLHWVDSNNNVSITSKSKKLFTHQDDIKIIWNDFPYNFENDVSHICVWTKLPIPSDPESPVGDVADDARAVIDRYVEKNLIENLGLEREHVVWFRNFPALQSVTELSHIHILIKGLDKKVLESLIGTSGLVLTQEEHQEAVKSVCRA